MEDGTFTSNEDFPYAVVLDLVPSGSRPPESWDFYSFVLLIQGIFLTMSPEFNKKLFKMKLCNTQLITKSTLKIFERFWSKLLELQKY